MPVTASVKRELQWWLAAFSSTRYSSIPLASRLVFPDPCDKGVLAAYSDASRELASPESSGWGAWAVVAREVVYVEGRWLPWELQNLSINVLELAAMQFGTFTFMAHAGARGAAVTHVIEFTDNTAAEHSAERGRPSNWRMQALVKWRYDRLEQLGIHSAVTRVASVDNDVADGLSRGGDMMRDALRMARSLGLPLRRLEVAAVVRDLTFIRVDDS